MSTPWPAMITGSLACSMSRAALRTWTMLRLGRRVVAGHRDFRRVRELLLFLQHVLRARRRAPAPGGPVRARWNASFMACGELSERRERGSCAW